MSLSSTVNRWPYTGNNIATSFAFTTKIFATSDLRVTSRNISTSAETTLALTTDYTVSGVGDDAGGSITLVAGALSSAYKLIIRRVRPLTQSTRIRNQTEYYAETHENQFDQFTMADQQQQDELDRSVGLPETISASDFNPKFPSDLVGRANVIPALNGTGTGWAAASDWLSLNDLYDLVTASDDSADEAAASAAAALVSELAAAASADDAAASAAAAAASAAAANSAVELAGSRAAPNSILAAVAIETSLTAKEVHQYIQGSGGAVTMSANPQIVVGTSVGQKMLLIGRSDTNTVTIANGNGVSLNGDITLGQDDTLYIYWDGTNWSEISRRR
jgi:hypothetical protein